jgi:hypothetical protein
MFKAKKKFSGVIFGVVLGSLIGTVAYFVQPAQWKGQALVRIGQVSQSQNNFSSIEPMTTVVDRLRSYSFVQAVAKRAKRSEVKALLNVDEEAGMSIKQARNGDSLVITVMGRSSELVKASIDAVVAELIFKHEGLLNDYERDIRNELLTLDAEVNAISNRVEAASKKNRMETGFSILASQNILEEKLKRASLLRDSISSANIRPTALLEQTSMSELRIFSSLWRACLLGALMGVVVSEVWVRWKK